MPIKSWTKLRQLSGTDRLVLGVAVLLLPAIHFGLLVLGYLRLHRLLEMVPPATWFQNRREESEVVHDAQQMARIVSIAAHRGFFRATCLRSSLLLWWLLRWKGTQSQICFGVRKIRGQLEAHAWVECNGIVIDDLGGTRALYSALGKGLPPTTLGL